MKIKRYGQIAKLGECATGEYVKYEDHIKAIDDVIAEAKRVVNEEIAKLKKGIIEDYNQAIAAIMGEK